jgi:hypothetical protein
LIVPHVLSNSLINADEMLPCKILLPLRVELGSSLPLMTEVTSEIVAPVFAATALSRELNVPVGSSPDKVVLRSPTRLCGIVDAFFKEGSSNHTSVPLVPTVTPSTRRTWVTEAGTVNTPEMVVKPPEVPVATREATVVVANTESPL